MDAARSLSITVPLAEHARTDELLAATARAIDGAGIGESPRLDAMLLLSHVTERPKASLLAFPERAVSRADRLELELK